MEILPRQHDIPRNPVGQILTHDERSIALLDLGRDASRALRASWPTDQPFQTGGVVESTWLLPMLGAGSTAASSLMAGNVFLATVNPATLMTIGSGVGSAVMGSTGIVAQVPFIAASSALMPVVAPVMLFTTVSSLVMCARLDRAQRTLGRLVEVVERVRRLLDAEDYARFETAAERIDEIRSEFEHCRRFASDVPDKLARIDHDVGVLRSKYGRMMTGDVDSEDGARAAVSDLNRFFLASLYDVQIDVLQLYLAIQNDADVVEFRQSRLREKIRGYGGDFRQVLEDDRVGAYHRELKGVCPSQFGGVFPVIWVAAENRRRRCERSGPFGRTSIRSEGAWSSGSKRVRRSRTNRGGRGWCSTGILMMSGGCGRFIRGRFGWRGWGGSRPAEMAARPCNSRDAI